MYHKHRLLELHWFSVASTAGSLSFCQVFIEWQRQSTSWQMSVSTPNILEDATHEQVWGLNFSHLLRFPQWRLDSGIIFTEKKKAYTTTTERNSFGELFWPQRKPFQAGGGYKNPMKTTKTISTTEIFPLWPPFFCSAKKSSALEQGCVCFLFPSFRKQHLQRRKRFDGELCTPDVILRIKLEVCWRYGQADTRVIKYMKMDRASWTQSVANKWPEYGWRT